MKDIEGVLKQKQSELQKLEAPEELENRLRAALNKTRKPGERINRGLVAAVITLILIFSYSFDTLAYYGKKMMGYETVVQGNIAELNQEGAGQEIGRSHTFSNGVEILLEGIMFDENELIAFSRIKSSGPAIHEVTLLMELNGLNPVRYPASGGRGLSVDERTQILVQSFEAPDFYEKWLSLEITMIPRHGNLEKGSIPFTLDRSKAMKRMVRQDIEEQAVLDNFKITFESLTASRLNTTIQGVIESQPTDGPQAYGDEHPSLRFDVFVDNKLYDTAYVGIDRGEEMDFSTEIMGLPANFESVDFRNFRLVRMKTMDRSVDISLDTQNLILDKDLAITRVYREGDQTVVAVKSRGVPVIGLFIEDKQVKATENSVYSGFPAQEEAVERIYRFEGQGEEMNLRFKGISYTKYAEDTIVLKVVEL